MPTFISQETQYVQTQNRQQKVSPPFRGKAMVIVCEGVDVRLSALKYLFTIGADLVIGVVMVIRLRLVVFAVAEQFLRALQ